MSEVAKLTIDSSKIPSSQTDFPVYVDLADMNEKFWSTVANGGGDIRVFKSDGTTELAREVVSCDTTGETGELHFKYTGTLSSSTDTEVQIHADGTSSDYATTDTYGAENVWTNYVGVWHDGGGNDSTASGHTGTANGGVSAGDITGKLGTGTNYDGADDYYSYADSADWDTIDSTGTLQFWHNQDILPGEFAFERVISREDSAEKWSFTLERGLGGNNLAFESPDTGSSFEMTAPTTGVWQKRDVAYNGSGREGYLNGSSDATASANDIGSGSSTVAFGAKTDNSQWMDGKLDEVRFCKLRLSADWITTEYNNQNSPSTFYTVTDPGVSVEPPVETLTLNTFAPTLSFTDPVTVSVPLLELTLSTFIPSLIVGVWSNGQKHTAVLTNTDKNSASWTNDTKS